MRIARVLVALALILPSAAPTLGLGPSDDPLVVTGIVEPDVILPGMPTSVRLTVVNRSRTAQVLSPYFVVEAIADEREAFVACGPLYDVCNGRVPKVYDAQLVIPPDGKREFFIPLGEGIVFPGYFVDRRLRKPGSVRLRLVFDDKLIPFPELRRDGMLDRTSYPAALSTNDMMLRVDEPRGRDAELLELLRAEYRVTTFCELSPEKAKKFAIAHASDFSDSKFGAYLAVMVPTSTEDTPALLERMEAMGAPAMLIDRTRLGLAERVHQQAKQARYDGKEEAADALYRRARTLVAEAASKARTSLGRLNAEKAEREMSAAE